MIRDRVVQKTNAGLVGALLLLATVECFAAAAPMTIAQLALYQGADREKILIEGAKKEGAFMLYGSHTWYRTMVREFEKKYPFIKVSEYRTDGRNLIKRALEEIRAGQYIADVIATTGEQMDLMKREGVFLEHHVPDARHYPEEVRHKGKSGFFYVGHYETYASLGFNTSLIPAAEAPKTMLDLLHPKWKGRMSIVSTNHGNPLGWQHAGKFRPGVSGEDRRTGGKGAEHVRSRFIRAGSLG